MPDGNPLVAQSQSQTTGVTGIGILESANDLASGVKDGSWVEGGLGAVGVGLEVLSMVVDPIGTLAQYGVSWLIEHVQPLKECLDWLAGDPPVIQSFSDTWANVAAEVTAISGDMANEVKNGTSGWSGAAGDAYRGEAAEQTDALAGAASLADGISTGVMVMGQVVAAVRETVRDLIAELVGKLITWALEAACTLGFATPLIAAQATTAITGAISKVTTLIRKLIKTISNVGPKVKKIVDKLGEIIEKLSKLAKKLGKGDGGTAPSSAARKADAPTTPSGTHDMPDGTTSPSSVDTPHVGEPGARTSPSGTDGDAPSRPGDATQTKTPQESRTKCNDPIDVVTGEMVLHQRDVELIAEFPLVLTRTHVSSYRAGRLFGRSWASTIDQRLEFDSEGVVFVADDGMLLVFPVPAEDGSAVVPRFGPRWELAKDTGGYLIRQQELGRTLWFSDTGSLGFFEDRNGTRIDFVRDVDGVLTAVSHSSGYRLDVSTDRGRVTALALVQADGAGITISRYRYDERGDLVEVVNSSEQPLSFTYDTGGRITRWDDRNGHWYRYLYDGAGRCVANEGSGGFLNGTFAYDHENRSTRFTDGLGHTTEFRFNELNQLVLEIDPLGNEVKQEWDVRDRLLSRTDPLGRVTRNEYDVSGNLSAVTHPDGSRQLAEYNESGLPAIVVDPDGAVWRQEYDRRGNLALMTDPSGAVTRYSHDESGAVISIVDPLGNVHRIENNSAGLPVAITDPLGNKTLYTRDVFGRVASIADPAGGVTKLGWTVEGRQAWLTQPDGATQRWMYDGEGNESRHVDANGGVTIRETTHLDLLAAQTEPDGARTEFAYDATLNLTAVKNPQGLVWRYEYDAAGNLIGETDFDGRRTDYTCDGAGQVVMRTNALGQSTTFHYDWLGNVVRRQGEDGAESTFGFDEAGRMVRAVNAASDLVITRDELGRIVREEINGRAVESAYDRMGRRERRRTPSGAVSSWRYDANNQPVRLNIAQRTLSFGYDVAGREIERVLDSGAVLAQAWDVNHRIVSQTASAVVTDRAGARQVEVVQQRSYQYRPDGFVVAVGDRLRGARRFALDAVGRVRDVRGENWAERYGYDRSGNVAAASWPEADAGNQGARQYAGTVIQRAGNTRYRHDGQGRMVFMQKKRISAKPDNWHFAWNSEDRLVGVVTPDGTRWRYTYDALGRRIAKQRLGRDGDEVVEQVDFVWDGSQLAEQSHSGGSATTWEWEPGGARPVVQVERVRELSQQYVDSRYYSIVTDLVGAPTELVDPNGVLAWDSRTNIWGESTGGRGGDVSTPLRLPGQYFDPETGLNYNLQRYFDPVAATYLSADPLGLPGGSNPHGYVVNPMTWMDPLGLQGKECWENAVRAKKSTPAGKLTSPQQRDLAKFAGLKEVPNARMKKQPVFTDGKRFYTYDLDGHNGGLFKVAKDIKSLGAKDTRGGTVGLGRPGGSKEPWQMYDVGA